MTLVPMKKICLKCGKMYEFNPDVGVGLFCPYCKSQGFIDKIRKIIFDSGKRNPRLLHQKLQAVFLLSVFRFAVRM